MRQMKPKTLLGGLEACPFNMSRLIAEVAAFVSGYYRNPEDGMMNAPA